MNRRFVIWLAATVAIVAVPLLLEHRRSEQREPRSLQLSELLEQRTTRPNEARLSALRAHRPYSGVGKAIEAPQAAAQIRDVIRDADQEGATRPSIVAASTVELLWGDKTAAAARLSHAVARDPSHHEAWLDLSAVQLTRAIDEPEVAGQLLAASVNAALTATRLVDADSSAWFNLTLALQRFGVTEAAAGALRKAIEREPDEAWRTEYRSRLTSLEQQNLHRQRWQADRKLLLDPSSAISDERLAELVRDRHQQVRELLEDALLPDWGEKILQPDPDGAALALRRATALAAALRASSGDARVARAIEQISASHDHRALASAHRSYGYARQLYEDTNREAALVEIDRSIGNLQALGSVFVDRARLTRAMTLYQLGRYREAEQQARDIEQRSARDQAPSVEGAAAWLLGIALTQRGAADDAILAFGRAARRFAQLNELEDLAAVENSSANLFRVTGDVSSGWRHVLNATRRIDHVYTARRRHTIMLNASLFAAQHDQLLAALEFEEWSLRAAQERGVANTIVDAFMRRARLRLRTGNISGAASDLDLAAQQASRISSQSARSYLDSWLALVSGESLLTQSPGDALTAFSRAKELFAATEPAELPTVFLASARARHRLGDLKRAEDDLLQGIEVVTSRREQIRGATLQASYQDVSWELFDRLIDLYVERGSPEDAFRLSEASRTLLLANALDPSSTVTAEGVARALSPDVTLVYYVATTERLLIWTLARGRASLATAPIGRTELESLVNRYRAALLANAPELDTLARRLHQLLLSDPLQGAPENSRVIVVPDGALHRLPLASLRDERGRYLIESHALATVPSATAFLRANHRHQPGAARGSIVLVGSSVVPSMPPLPEVASEIRAIAALYPDARPLLGPLATFGNTLRAIKGASILHFAGHAKANADIPWQSKLFFVPDKAVQNGIVTAEMLREVDLASLQLVVFSACETGDGPILRGTGVSSLASTLLYRGVPSVVASLWAVDDRAMKALLTGFHTAYADGTPSASALRAAQLVMLRSTDPQLSRPQHWSGVTIASAR